MSEEIAIDHISDARKKIKAGQNIFRRQSVAPILDQAEKIKFENIALRTELETTRMERDYRPRMDELERLTAELAEANNRICQYQIEVTRTSKENAELTAELAEANHLAEKMTAERDSAIDEIHALNENLKIAGIRIHWGVGGHNS